MINKFTSGILNAAATLDPNLGLYVNVMRNGVADAQVIAEDLADLFPDFFYIKKALGQNAKQIDVYKVRTMRKNADQELIELIAQQGLDELGKINGDPRITRLGDFLREKSWDEIPNLLSLAKGELMIVGPRPRSINDWSAYPAEHRDICLQVMPGCLPSIYADLPQTVSEQIKSNERFVERYLKDPIATTVDYSARATWNLARKKVKNR
jgi:hypothetical protein